MKKKLKEQVVQKFPYRCPYCDQPISYDQFDLKVGENKIQCPSCKKIYIKVVSDSIENNLIILLSSGGLRPGRASGSERRGRG
jgi:Zn finger protein HypA/HybF involved in hydrogenase expression